MAGGSIITEEMRSAVGTELSRFTFDVEKVLVRRLLDAIDDHNPLWENVVPPSLFMTAFAQGGTLDLPFDIPVKRILDGGGGWEFLLPVKLGDTITAAKKMTSLRERKGKLGQMLFAAFETTWSNQEGLTVAVGQSTIIWY